MKIQNSPLLILSATLFAVALAGCGGGGGSSNGPATPTPTPTRIPPTGVNVTVQLRDTANAPVDGIVTIGVQQRATTQGTANFFDVPAGALTARAEVNGATYSQNFVATLGANTVQIAINPAVGGTSGTATGGNPPPPPAFE